MISPFNFPAALTGGPVGAALVTGNTVVMKPATDTPWVVRLLAECFRDAGLPDGVVNYVTGPGRTLGQALISCPEVDGVTFTGSLDVGMRIYPRFCRLQLAAPDHPGAGRQEPGDRLPPCRSGTRRGRASCARPLGCRGRSARPARASTSKSRCTTQLVGRMVELTKQADHRRPDRALRLPGPGDQPELVPGVPGVHALSWPRPARS